MATHFTFGVTMATHFTFAATMATHYTFAVTALGNTIHSFYNSNVVLNA